MTAAFSMQGNADCEEWDLRKVSETMSKVAVALRVPFCLARAAGVTHSTKRSYQCQILGIRRGGKANRIFFHRNMSKR